MEIRHFAAVLLVAGTAILAADARADDCMEQAARLESKIGNSFLAENYPQMAKKLIAELREEAVRRDDAECRRIAESLADEAGEEGETDKLSASSSEEAPPKPPTMLTATTD